MRQAEFSLVSGAQAQEQLMDVLTNNLANVNTPGFKRDRVTFRTYLPHREWLHKTPSDQPGVRMTPWGEFPTPWGMAGKDVPHAGVDAIHVGYAQGSFRTTGNPLDVAVNGPGFFRIQTPRGELLSRNGRFTLDRGGRLVTHEGYGVLGEDGKNIRLPESVPGTIRVKADGTLLKGTRVMGRLAVVMPENGTDHLSKIGDGLFLPDGKTRPVDKPDILAGGFESSNVNGTFEMVRMIEAMRSFETHLKALQTLNELTRRTVNDISVIA
ncbi:MAG: flagellar hook-basal body protein [Nitrospirae bacterium]|jgi:flagellar basal-body rod protein FlgG|nr:flagellar hook-basal body protein [Nitrospirota bacterium]